MFRKQPPCHVPFCTFLIKATVPRYRISSYKVSTPSLRPLSSVFANVSASSLCFRIDSHSIHWLFTFRRTMVLYSCSPPRGKSLCTIWSYHRQSSQFPDIHSLTSPFCRRCQADTSCWWRPSAV